MIKYIILVALGALSFGALTSFAKIAYGQGYSAAEVTLFQTLFGSIILWMIVICKGVYKRTLKLIGGGKLLLAGTSMGIATYTYYLSVEFIPASLAIVLLMQMTWMSILLECLFSRRKPSIVEMVTSFFLFIGSLFAANFFNLINSHFSLFGIFLGLLSALLYSLYILFTSRLGNDTPVFEKSALMTTGSAFMIFLINFKSILTSNNLDFVLVEWGVFLAVFGTVIPPICFTIGMPKIGAGLSSTLLTLELPAAIFSANIILGEHICFLQIIGIIVMLGSIIYINLLKTKIHQSPS